MLYNYCSGVVFCISQAASITNIDVINSVTDTEKQAEGHRLLMAYCVAFNASFHLVEFLYECNPNPFLMEDGSVDLTGSRGKSGSVAAEDVGMNIHTTINFSLPSASHGETDATGLCTIKLLSSLEVRQLPQRVLYFEITASVTASATATALPLPFDVMLDIVS